MTRKHFIALADFIKLHNDEFDKGFRPSYGRFDTHHILLLSEFLMTQNPRFNHARWLGYIRGTNGPYGGKIK